MEKLLNKLINKCPATMLADNRTDSVIGRMILLVNSIITIKFIRAAGVPDGRRCDIMNFVLFIHPKYIMFNHRIRAVVKEMEMCAVGVKMKGQRAKRFLSIIIINSDFMKIRLPE